MYSYNDEQEKLYKTWKEDFNTCGFDGPKDFLWIYVMKGCGCGQSDTYREDFWAMFEKIAKKEDRFEYISKDLYHELIAQMLDSRGLLDHGSSIYGSWLSPAGEKLYKLLTTPHDKQ